MKLIKGIFTLVGALVIIGMAFAFVKFDLGKMDSKAMGLYMNMAEKVITTGDPAKGMVIKRKLVIHEDETKAEAIENAIDIMDEIADEHGLAVVDKKTMPRSQLNKDGEKVYTHIRSYCSPAIADVFLKFSGEFVGFMPCRIGIVEDGNGDVWIYTMGLDLMIHGGHELPAEMLDLANTVKEAMNSMIIQGAANDD